MVHLLYSGHHIARTWRRQAPESNVMHLFFLQLIYSNMLSYHRARLNHILSKAALNNQEWTLFGLANRERKWAGLQPLWLNARLTLLARLKSQDMINDRYFSHQSPRFGRIGNLLRTAGIPFTLAAENISRGGNARSAFSAFMQSSGHRRKILDPRYTQTGVGARTDERRVLFMTQIFVRPK